MSVMENYTADKKGGMEVLGDLSFKWYYYTGINEKCYLSKNLKEVKIHIKIFPSIENSQHNVLRLEYTWNTQKNSQQISVAI